MRGLNGVEQATACTLLKEKIISFEVQLLLPTLHREKKNAEKSQPIEKKDKTVEVGKEKRCMTKLERRWWNESKYTNNYSKCKWSVCSREKSNQTFLNTI